MMTKEEEIVKLKERIAVLNNSIADILTQVHPLARERDEAEQRMFALQVPFQVGDVVRNKRQKLFKITQRTPRGIVHGRAIKQDGTLSQRKVWIGSMAGSDYQVVEG